jgi:hypothetical protein|tara:strand:+ start:773 stop:1054 length:282 start_codon:yes stop_codon:yes gene_type:complete
MGVSHGLGIGCLALVVGIGIAAITNTDELFICWVCVLPLSLAGIGFFIPNKDNTVVIYQDRVQAIDTIVVSQEEFYQMDTNKDGVISPEEYNR